MKPPLPTQPTPTQQTDAQIRSDIMRCPSPTAFTAWIQTEPAVRSRVIAQIVAGIWTIQSVIDYLTKGQPYHDDPNKRAD